MSVCVSVSVLGNGLDGMPWLAPYSGQQGYQNQDESVKWGVAAEEASKPVPQLADPLWYCVPNVLLKCC